MDEKDKEIKKLRKALNKELYKAEGLRRAKIRKQKRRAKRLEKIRMYQRLNEYGGRCCEYGSQGQTHCDGSC